MVRRWWCKWSAAAMVIVGRDQTRHYYYDCCTILQPPPPTTAKNPTAFWGQNGRLSRRVLASALALQNRVAGPPVALPRGRFLNRPRGPSQGHRRRVAFARRSPYALSARARPRSIHRVRGAGEGNAIVGGGWTDPHRGQGAGDGAWRV